MNPVLGTFSGVVVAAQDPQNRGRARLRVPQVLGTAVSGWAEPVSVGAAEPGDQVYVSFEGGDRNRPLYWPRLRQSVISSWAPLELESGWQAASLGEPAARLGPDGMIELAGSVLPASLSLGVNTVFAALPDGLEPLHRVIQPVATIYRSSFAAKTVLGEHRTTFTLAATTTYRTHADGPVVNFVAPGDGQVIVDLGCFAQNSTDLGRALMTAQIKDGSTVILGADESNNRSAEVQSGDNVTASMAFPVTGLVPGRTYTAEAMYRSDGTGNDASFDNKWIKISPRFPYSAPVGRVTIETSGALGLLLPEGQSPPYETSLAGVRARAV